MVSWLVTVGIHAVAATISSEHGDKLMSAYPMAPHKTNLLCIIKLAIEPYQLDIFVGLYQGLVLAIDNVLLDCSQVHWLFDNLGVVK
jgi:hypothetical protein